jgi:hypothetical protein
LLDALPARTADGSPREKVVIATLATMVALR